MTGPDASDTSTNGLWPLLRGYLLMFEWRHVADYATPVGTSLLIVFAVLEYGIGPRTHVLDMLGVEQPSAWMRVAALIAIAVLGARLAGARPNDVGLLYPGFWTRSEVLFAAQALVIGIGILVALNFDALQALSPAIWPVIAAAYGTELLWGFYQELVYRGLLQTELVRRCGAVAGILIANVAFTFGPLHVQQLVGSAPDQTKEIFFGATFAIGMIFGYLAFRTRNIVFVGLLHGIGDAVANVPHVLHPR